LSSLFWINLFDFILISTPGPAFWGLINPEWSMCNRGRRQSPINIEPSQLLFDPNLRPLHIDKNAVRWLEQPCLCLQCAFRSEPRLRPALPWEKTDTDQEEQNVLIRMGGADQHWERPSSSTTSLWIMWSISAISLTALHASYSLQGHITTAMKGSSKRRERLMTSVLSDYDVGGEREERDERNWARLHRVITTTRRKRNAEIDRWWWGNFEHHQERLVSPLCISLVSRVYHLPPHLSLRNYGALVRSTERRDWGW